MTAWNSETWAGCLEGRNSRHESSRVIKGSDLVPNANSGTSHSHGPLTFFYALGSSAVRCNSTSADPRGGRGLGKMMHAWLGHVARTWELLLLYSLVRSSHGNIPWIKLLGHNCCFDTQASYHFFVTFYNSSFAYQKETRILGAFTFSVKQSKDI